MNDEEIQAFLGEMIQPNRETEEKLVDERDIAAEIAGQVVENKDDKDKDKEDEKKQ
jgi:hypothetical protein